MNHSLQAVKHLYLNSWHSGGPGRVYLCEIRTQHKYIPIVQSVNGVTFVNGEVPQEDVYQTKMDQPA